MQSGRTGQYRLSVCITGASGAIYGVRLLQALTSAGHHVDLVISASGLKCLNLECGLPENAKEALQALTLPPDRIKLHHPENIASTLASGSSLRSLHAGFIVPCSMGTAARIAHGISSNLIERHADVLLKERKPLVIVPRETPLSALHLENLLKLTQLGAHCLAAMPGFYHAPQSIDDLVNHVVGKALDAVAIEHELYKRWEHA